MESSITNSNFVTVHTNALQLLCKMISHYKLLQQQIVGSLRQYEQNHRETSQAQMLVSSQTAELQFHQLFHVFAILAVVQLLSGPVSKTHQEIWNIRVIKYKGHKVSTHEVFSKLVHSIFLKFYQVKCIKKWAKTLFWVLDENSS